MDVGINSGGYSNNNMRKRNFKRGRVWEIVVGTIIVSIWILSKVFTRLKKMVRLPTAPLNQQLDLLDVSSIISQ